MKKQKNKQGIKASKLAKAENKLKKQAEQMITVKNAEGEPDTQAKILIQNKVNYTPKVSVIIPVYNVEEYLRECLDSVVNQTLKEIEIICVDDGSTDNSLEILKEYAKKDNRISVLTQENFELNGVTPHIKCPENTDALDVALREIVNQRNLSQLMNSNDKAR